MNEEIKKLIEQIKNRLNELGMSEFVVYASDYCGELDEDVVEEKVADSAGSLGFRIHINEDYSGYSSTDTYIRKIKLKDDDIVFDIETVYEDNDGGYESTGYYEDQSMERILQSCSEDWVIDGLKAVIKYALTENGYYDIIGLNRL